MGKVGFFFCLIVASASIARGDEPCPKNDFKACAKVLDRANKADQGKSFIGVYDDICARNSKFKCVKVTVMGDIKQAMGEFREEHPKAKLYPAEQEDGKYIYSFEKK